jgi:dTDP-4-amino-4,6-dideoxygalactose transaminase
MKVPFYNFNQLHHHDFKQQIMQRFEEIVNNNAFVEGKYNQSFEARFAKMQQAKYAPLLANGTDALEIALLAYGIKPGDKVGVAAISFFATAECVYNVGATPIFIDVDPASGLICPASTKRMIERHRLKAIIPVHIYGQPAPISELEAICQEYDVKIVEDGAQAQGGFYANKKPIGSSNNITTFSFYPTKNLSAFGDAGGITTQDDKLNEIIVSIRNHGRSPNGHALIGRNSRCDHLQAAVLDLKLDQIEEYNQMRKVVAKKYYQALAGLNLRLVPESLVELSSWHLFPIGLKDRTQKYELKKFLDSEQIGSALFYEKAMPEETPLASVEGEREHAIGFAHSTLCLPMNPFVTDEQISLVAAAIKKFLS